MLGNRRRTRRGAGGNVGGWGCGHVGWQAEGKERIRKEGGGRGREGADKVKGADKEEGEDTERGGYKEGGTDTEVRAR